MFTGLDAAMTRYLKTNITMRGNTGGTLLIHTPPSCMTAEDKHCNSRACPQMSIQIFAWSDITRYFNMTHTLGCAIVLHRLTQTNYYRQLLRQ